MFLYARFLFCIGKIFFDFSEDFVDWRKD